MAGLTTTWVATEMRRRGYDVREGADSPITGGAPDSRRVRPGDLFTAFPGEHTNGNLFIDDAIAAGAVAVVCSRLPSQQPRGLTFVLASDTTRAVGELARAWREACAPRVVGITGTVGKTTAKETTASILSSRFRTHRSPGNLNSREGLPLALMSLDSEDDVSVLELAMDSVGEIADLCEIARPEVGVVLNIGLTHVSKLGSIEAIAAEKLSLPRWLGPDGTAVLNADDRRVSAVVPELACRVITFGSCERASLRATDIEDHGLAGTEFRISFAGAKTHVRSPLPGRHLVPAVLAATAAALALGMDIEEAAEAARKAANGRMRLAPGRNGSTILDDRYNSSPASLAGALQLLARLPGRRIALLGKMAELGEQSLDEHRRAGEVAAASADLIATFGDECLPLAEAARAAGHAHVHWFTGRDAAASFVAEHLGQGDHVLVKGSRSEALEDVLPLLEDGP